jgi:hypothetical protein
MAETDSTICVNGERFDSATLKLDGAKSLVSAMGILMHEASLLNGNIPIGGELLNSSMNGIRCLIDSALDDLLSDQKSEVAA